MSQNISVYLCCDLCGFSYYMGCHIAARANRAIAREQGWRVRKRDGFRIDVCPECEKEPPPTQGEGEGNE